MSTCRSLAIRLFLLCAACLGVVGTTEAAVTLYYYSAENCPHCREVGPDIRRLAERTGAILVEKDIWKDRAAFSELIGLLETYGDLPVGTPTLFLGDRVWLGMDQEKLTELEAALRDCVVHGCPDALTRLQAAQHQTPETPEPAETTVTLPVLGAWEADEVSLPVLTLVLGLLDSVNPCAFFVLLFLLSLMIHAHSRIRMLTVGVVFIVCSGLIYFLFMAAWLNLFLATGGLRVVTLLAGLVALLIGVFNLKDFWLLHSGPSLSIPDKVKPGLYHRVRELVKSANYAALLGSTVLLAIAANSYELLCTAGFPMVFTRILTLHQLPTWQYYGYLAFYNLVYILPLLLIVVLFAVTLGAHQLSERGGRRLKLLSGAMMAAMGLVLVFAPEQLQSLAGALTTLGAALLLVGLVLLVEKLWQGHRPSR